MNENDYFTIQWGDYDIGSMFDGITKIERGIGNKWNNKTTTGVGRYGEKFLSNYLDSKLIKIEFIKYGDQEVWRKFRDDMAFILDTTTTQQLKFNDEPNIYYDAVPDGEVSLNEDINEGEAKGTLTFLVADGLKHSVVMKQYVFDPNNHDESAVVDPDDGSVTIKLPNKATAESYPIIKVEMLSPNSYVGVSGYNGVFAVGSQEEVIIDSKSSVKTTTVSETLTKNDAKEGVKANFDGWKDVWESTSGAGYFKNPQNPSILALDTIGWVQSDQAGIYAVNSGHDPNPIDTGQWWFHGGVKVWTVPADSTGEVGATDFTSNITTIAHAHRFGQTGLLQMLYLDEDKKLICGFGIYKKDDKGNKAEFQLYIGGPEQKTYKTKAFETNNGGIGDGRQANPNRYFNTKTGQLTVKKEGGKITWTLNSRGGSENIIVPDLEEKKCKYVYMFIGNHKNRDLKRGGWKFVTRLGFQRFRFVKGGIKKTTDNTNGTTTIIPEDKNHFGEGENVVFNMEQANVYRYEGTTLANDEVITGSRFFSLPPGETELSFMFGTDAATPKITVEWRENYL